MAATSVRIGVPDLTLFSGVARGIQHLCPSASLREAYNEIQIKRLPGELEQKIVRVELRIVPK